jgi:hypothetical protein
LSHYTIYGLAGKNTASGINEWPYVLYSGKNDEDEKGHQKDENEKERIKGDKIEGKFQNDKEAAMGM